MFERFTDHARRVVVLAQAKARTLNHEHIGTEHLLLALIHEGDGGAATALESLGISLDAVGERVREIVGPGQKTPSGHLPLTPRAREVLVLSLDEAQQLGHTDVGTEHLLLGLLREGEGVAARVLVRLGADLDQVRPRVVELLSGSGQRPPPGVEAPAGPTPSARPGPLGRDLTAAAQGGLLSPIVGRTRELRRVLVALGTGNRDNPLLLGEPGVGKTAIVHAVAVALAAPRVHAVLAGRRLLLVDVTAEGAAGLDRAVREASRDRRLLLVVESVLAPLPDRPGTTPAGLLAAALARREVQVIATTTPSEYRRAALESPDVLRPFRAVPVAGLSVEETEAVLAQGRPALEARLTVVVTEDALRAAARLCADRTPDRPLPGAAVDLLEQAAVLAALERGDAQVTVGPPDVEAALDSLAGTGVMDLPPAGRPAGREQPVPHPFGTDDPVDIWAVS